MSSGGEAGAVGNRQALLRLAPRGGAGGWAPPASCSPVVPASELFPPCTHLPPPACRSILCRCNHQLPPPAGRLSPRQPGPGVRGWSGLRGGGSCGGGTGSAGCVGVQAFLEDGDHRDRPQHSCAGGVLQVWRCVWVSRLGSQVVGGFGSRQGRAHVAGCGSTRDDGAVDPRRGAQAPGGRRAVSTWLVPTWHPASGSACL